jgi:hypothetical protein
MLLALAPIMLVAAAILVRFRGQAATGEAADIAEPRMSGLRTLASSAYLRRLASVVIVGGTSAAALDYAFKSSAATLGQPERLAEFFSAYYMAVSVVTVLLQGTLSRFSLDRFGIGVTLAVLPAALLLGSGASAAIGGLWSIVVLRGAEAALSNSFFRSAYEPLYTPLPPQKKRASKAIIDVAADRVGDAVGSLAILLFMTLLPEQLRLAALGVVALGALISLWLSHRLQRGYVAELANSLRKGLVRLSPQEIADKTTRLTLSRTHGEIDREAILREVETLRRGQRPEPELAKNAGELASGDGARIRAVLEQEPLDRRLLSFVIPMLEFDELREPVTRALTTMASNAVGQLSDCLLDPNLPPKARQRIPGLLAGIGGQRAVRALTEGLFANEFALRESAARALLGLRRRDPSWRPPETLLVAVVRRELETRAGMARSEPSDVESKDELPVINAPSENRMLRHVFTLLALTLEPESVELSLRALAAGDPKLRGTALEYLENVIPGELRAELWPHLRDHRQGPRRSTPRTQQELAAELKRSFSG